MLFSFIMLILLTSFPFLPFCLWFTPPIKHTIQPRLHLLFILSMSYPSSIHHIPHLFIFLIPTWSLSQESFVLNLRHLLSKHKQETSSKNTFKLISSDTLILNEKFSLKINSTFFLTVEFFYKISECSAECDIHVWKNQHYLLSPILLEHISLHMCLWILAR